MYVDERNPANRKEIIEFLENKGYYPKHKEVDFREGVINSFFPIIVNPLDKEYSLLNSVMCAAAAASSKILKTKEELYRYFENN